MQKSHYFEHQLGKPAVFRNVIGINSENLNKPLLEVWVLKTVTTGSCVRSTTASLKSPQIMIASHGDILVRGSLIT